MTILMGKGAGRKALQGPGVVLLIIFNERIFFCNYRSSTNL